MNKITLLPLIPIGLIIIFTIYFGNQYYNGNHESSTNSIVQIQNKYFNPLGDENAFEIQIDKMIKNDAYESQYNYYGNSKYIINIERPNHAFQILNTKITLTTNDESGNNPVSIPSILSNHINQTLNNVKKDFTEHPFIVSYTYIPTNISQNKIIDTYYGKVVLNSEGGKVLLKPDGSQIPINDFGVGTWLKLNYVLHNNPCYLQNIELSNQSKPITSGNLTDIINNPQNHGIFNQTQSELKYSNWYMGKQTTDPTIIKYSYGDGGSEEIDYSNCNTHDSYTYELVESSH